MSAGADVGAPAPFSLLMRLFGDSDMAGVFSESASVDLWIRVEAELAAAQAAQSAISSAAARDVKAAADLLRADPPDIWAASANVGYPILALVRELDARTEADGTGRVHFGATTQDIMDTATAMQLRDATDVLVARLERLGAALAVLVEAHRSTVMAGRTHAQQAVPITLGMKFAVTLDQVACAIERLLTERKQVARISLFGAAGTSAAYGAGAGIVRSLVAARLGLHPADVPWHVARDAVFAQSANAVVAAEVGARLAREVIDLSRTEVGEVLEPAGVHRGASSTMPQKSNPILSEAIVGLAVSANAQLTAVGRAMEAGHERSAGEWQIEWHVLPQLFTLASSAVLRAAELAEQVVVDTAAIARNLAADHGLIMAEAYMIALSDAFGRERAHDLVSAACRRTRQERRPLIDVLLEDLDPGLHSLVAGITPEDYIGEADAICAATLHRWTTRPANGKKE